MSFVDKRRELRWRYMQEPWTRRTCSIPGCGAETFSLHHAHYQNAGPTEILALVPLCAEHHRRLEFEILPGSKLSRPGATMCYIVHGDNLRQWPEWATPIITRPHGDQLDLWDQQDAA